MLLVSAAFIKLYCTTLSISLIGVYTDGRDSNISDVTLDGRGTRR